MPTQLEYGIRRAACISELGKRMHNGLSHYFTGPKSYYPNKVLNTPPLISQAIIVAVPGDLKNYLLQMRKLCVTFQFHLEEAFTSIPLETRVKK